MRTVLAHVSSSGHQGTVWQNTLLLHRAATLVHPQWRRSNLQARFDRAGFSGPNALSGKELGLDEESEDGALV